MVNEIATIPVPEKKKLSGLTWIGKAVEIKVDRKMVSETDNCKSVV